MKHSGKARKAAFKLILMSLAVLAVVLALGCITPVVKVIASVAIVVWLLFTVFTLYFFRDPDAQVPAGANLVLAPAHGQVDVVGMGTEPDFMGGECQRISIFLSVVDIHVQNAPVGGKVAWFKYTTGQFLNALKAESAIYNENALLGFEESEPRGRKVGVRLIAGLIARRIVPWIGPEEMIPRSERIGLIRFGSRVELYLPLGVKIMAQTGQKVIGGQSILATYE